MTPRIVAAEIVLVALLIVPFCALLRVRRGEPLRQVLVSSVLFIVIGAQIAMGVALVDHAWPITGYPMYASRPGIGEIKTENLRFWGTTRDGREVDVPMHEVYVDPNDLVPRALPLLRDPATRETIAKGLMDYYNVHRADETDRLTSLRIALLLQRWGEDRALLDEQTAPLMTYGR